MSSGTSYNGWPAHSDKSVIGVVSSEWFPGGAKSGDVTTVLSYVARQFNARVEPIVGGWCWGYTYKTNANNPNQLSCHASGTAIDANAPDHPNGSGGTFTNAQRGEIYAILDEVQGTVAWLEGYDEMHFEICVDASTLAYVAAIIGDAAPPTGSTPPPTTTDWLDMATQAELEAAFTAALNNNVHLSEIRRMLGVAIGYPPGSDTERNLAQLGGPVNAVGENVDELRRMLGVAIGYPPGSDTEHNLAQQ